MYHWNCQEYTNNFVRWQVQKANRARETQQLMASSNDDSQNQNQMLLQRQAQHMANQGQQQTAQQVPQLQTGNHLPLQMTAPAQMSTLALNMQHYILSQQQPSAQQQQQQQRPQQQLQAQ